MTTTKFYRNKVNFNYINFIDVCLQDRKLRNSMMNTKTMYILIVEDFISICEISKHDNESKVNKAIVSLIVDLTKLDQQKLAEDYVKSVETKTIHVDSLIKHFEWYMHEKSNDKWKPRNILKQNGF